jgi:hypothetical protein
MATNYIAPTWRQPENTNKDKLSNYSIEFNSNESITTSDNVSISGSQSRTMSVWLKGGSTNNGKSWPMAVAFGNGSTNQAMWIGGGDSPSAYWYFGFWGSPSATSGDLASTVRMDADNNWHLLTSVYDESTQTAKGYIDGVEVVSGSRPSINTGSSPLIIGKHLTQATYWDGPIAQVSIFDYALSNDQVTYLYNLNNPMVPGTVNLTAPIAYYPLGDNSNLTATAGYPNISVGADSVFDFEGPNLNEQFITTTYFPNGESNFTYSTWVNCNFYQRGALLAAYGGSTHQNFSISFWTGTGGVMYVFVGVGVYAQFANFTFHGYPINEWTNISILYDGTFTDADTATQNAGRLKLYINGNYEAFDSFVGTIPSTIPSGNTGFYLGALTPTTYEYGGKMSNVQMWNTTLLPANVTTLYNNGAPSMTSAQPQATNLKAWYKLNQTANWEADSTGNWQIPDNRSAYPQSFNFNNTTDAINIASGVSLGTLHTINFWVNFKPPYGTRAAYILSSGSENGWVVYANNGGTLYYKAGSSQYFSGTMTAPTAAGVGKWHNITITRNGANINFYQNGNTTPFATTSTFAGASTPLGDIDFISGDRSYGSSIRYSNFTFYNIEFSSSQVSQIYNNGIPLTSAIATDNLIAWYKLDDTSIWYENTGQWGIPNAASTSSEIINFSN